MGITERIDAITDIKGDALSITPPCPKSVKIELTARCNFACTFCATAHGMRKKGDMSIKFYDKLLKQLHTAGVEEVGMFFLGESFLLKDLPLKIKMAKDAGFPYVFITTNGSAAKTRTIRECMKAGLDSLKFSLNYADVLQFVDITRVKAIFFDRMIENIKAAYKIRETGQFKCGLYASYIQYDGEQGIRMGKLLDELKPYLDETYALPLYSQADLTGEKSSEAGWDVRAGNPGRAGNMREPIPCWSLFGEGRVTWDGKLAACCFDHDGRFDMGDLNEIDFMEAWHSEKFQALRQAHLNGDVSETACKTCVAYQ